MELTGGFNTTMMTYPNDLLSRGSEYGANYVVFYIRVHEDSYLFRDGATATVPARAVDRPTSPAGSLTEEQINAGVISGGAITGAATGVVARIARSIGSDVTSKSGIFKSDVTNATAGAAIATVAIAALGNSKKEYRQLKNAIALYVPESMAARYSASWSPESMAGMSALSMTSGGLIDAIKTAAKSGPREGFAAAGAPAQAAGGYVAGQLINVSPAGQFLGKTTGTAFNPKKEQLFQEMDFRTFDFKYEFFPRSQSEVTAVENIIKTFKMHMHPEFRPNTGEFLYIYPSEFDIVYYNNGQENPHIHKHLSSVLTSMSVSYSPQGTFTSFAGGIPTQISVNLSFKELSLLTKDLVEKGF